MTDRLKVGESGAPAPTQPQWVRESKPQSVTVMAEGVARDLAGCAAPEWLMARLLSWREAIIGQTLRVGAPVPVQDSPTKREG